MKKNHDEKEIRLCAECHEIIPKGANCFFLYRWNPTTSNPTQMVIDPVKTKPEGYLCQTCHDIGEGIN
jgi:hypothetical protein